MRALIVCLLATGCSEQGANLVAVGAGRAGDASSYEIVLASSDLVPVIGNQRVSPTALDGRDRSRYYLQRTAANASGSIDKVDGFRCSSSRTRRSRRRRSSRSCCCTTRATQLVGVGTYEADATGAPSPIVVKRGEVDEYPIAVEPLVEVVDTKPVSAGDAMQVTCGRTDQTTFRSGVVWRDAAGGELRLMLPDGDSDDATARALDLDCDGQSSRSRPRATTATTRARGSMPARPRCATARTRTATASPYARRAVLADATLGTCISPNTGVAICDHATADDRRVLDRERVRVRDGADRSGCRHCTLTYAHGTTAQGVTPCQPAIERARRHGLCTTAATCTSRCSARATAGRRRSRRRRRPRSGRARRV